MNYTTIALSIDDLSTTHSKEEPMSKSAFSAKLFAVYLFIAGVILVVAPNFFLSLLFIPQTSEVWIRMIGVMAFMIGIYAWVAATHEFRPFLVASVYTRCTVFVALGAFAALGLASPMINLIGLVELAGALWTHFALKADANSANAS